MSIIRDIAEQHAEKLGLGDNIPLIRSIEESILPARATLIRREAERKGMFPSWVMQTMECVYLEQVDFGECEPDYLGIPALRTKEKITRPIRTGLPDPFDFVGTTDGKESYKYVKPESLESYKNTRYISKHPRYIYVNDYIYIFNVYEEVMSIRAPFEDPESASSNESCNPKYEIEKDMIYLIKRFLDEEYRSGEAIRRSEQQDEQQDTV